MSDSTKTIRTNGIGFLGLLFIVLLVLKVGIGNTAVVTWSWWIITLPLWIGPSIVLVCVLAFLLFLLVVFVVTYVVTKIRNKNES